LEEKENKEVESMNPGTDTKQEKRETPSETRSEERVKTLEQSLKEATGKIESLETNLMQAVHSYREILVKHNPQILPEMIEGPTVEALESSLKRAEELIEKVKDNLNTQSASTRIPTGAPLRGENNAGSMSAWEKIRAGLGMSN